MSSPEELVDIEMRLLAETEKAILVTKADKDDEGSMDSVWLPKSQVEFTPPSPKGITTVTLPDWLAFNHDLI